MIIITTKIKNQDNQERVYHYSRRCEYIRMVYFGIRASHSMQTDRDGSDRQKQTRNKEARISTYTYTYRRSLLYKYTPLIVSTRYPDTFDSSRQKYIVYINISFDTMGVNYFFHSIQRIFPIFSFLFASIEPSIIES